MSTVQFTQTATPNLNLWQGFGCVLPLYVEVYTPPLPLSRILDQKCMRKPQFAASVGSARLICIPGTPHSAMSSTQFTELGPQITIAGLLNCLAAISRWLFMLVRTHSPHLAQSCMRISVRVNISKQFPLIKPQCRAKQIANAHAFHVNAQIWIHNYSNSQGTDVHSASVRGSGSNPAQALNHGRCVKDSHLSSGCASLIYKEVPNFWNL